MTKECLVSNAYDECQQNKFSGPDVKKLKRGTKIAMNTTQTDINFLMNLNFFLLSRKKLLTANIIPLCS